MAIIQNLDAFVQSYPAGLDSVTDLQLSQNENGRQIRFTIGGVTIPAGSVATISGTKPDGVVYSNTGTIEGADTVIFDEDVQMTAVFGTWYAKIRITNAGNTIASARVRFIIDKDPVDAGAIPSESQLNGLVAEAEEYAGAAEDAAERAAITYGSPLTAATASAMTDINRVYVYTGSESGYTYGNWYYYNGSAWVSGGVYNSAAVETDTTLTESGVPADAKATGDKIDELKDDFDQFVENFGSDVDTAVDNWLDVHPEATTTVQDGSLTLPKFSDSLKLETVNGYVTPEMFGAKGDGETDDSTAITNCMLYAYANSLPVHYEKKTYIVSGNNPCGLEQKVPTDSMNTQERYVNVDFGGATIVWTPQNENDCLAFVGYLRNATWENLRILVQGNNYYGNIFSTYFGIADAQHEFSWNIFRNISVDGKHNNTFNFNVGTNERQTHDDMSLFEKVYSKGFKNFYYTNNSNSVSNTFSNCGTNQNADSSTAFNIDSPSWGSSLRIVDHHFTIMDSNLSTILKMDCRNTPYATVYFEKPRAEIRDTATNWKYFNMRAGNADFGDMFTINYPIYSPLNIYGILEIDASVKFHDSYGVYTPFNLIGGQLSTGVDSATEALVFNHCSFVNGDTARSRQAYPLINYCDNNGTILSNRAVALASYAYGNIIIDNETSKWGNYSYDRWLKNYNLINTKICTINLDRHKMIQYGKSGSGAYGCCTRSFIVPFDLIITSMEYKQLSSNYNLQNQINNMRITFPDSALEEIRTNLTTAATSMSLIPEGKELYLKAGSVYNVRMYYDDTEKTETVFTSNTYLKIEYRLPASFVDYTRIETQGLDDVVNY